MPHQRWGNPFEGGYVPKKTQTLGERTPPKGGDGVPAVPRISVTSHDLLRENMRLRDRVEELEGGLKSAGERETKAKLGGSTRAKSVSVQRFWIALVGVAGAFVCWWFVAK